MTKKAKIKKTRTATSTCDVLIVGGGLVGASLACALRGSGLSVHVFEAHPLNTDTQPSYDDRTVALSYGSRIILDTMGIWEVLRGNVEAIETIHISDKGHFGATRLRHVEEQVEALGYVCENRVLGEALYQVLSESVDINLHCPARVVGIEQDNDSVQLEYEENGERSSIKTKLLVAADGVSSQVRELLQIDVSRQDYNQCAVVTNVTPGKLHENVAYERFTPDGPLAFLPMTAQRCSVVWTVPQDEAEVLMRLDDEAFLDRLQSCFGFRLGWLKKVGRRQSYPLALVQATQQVRGRVVVVGNAAHTLHPVAGQGFNLALRDIALLAELLVAAEDTGNASTLRLYQERRESDAKRVYRFTDTLVKVFSNSFSPLAHIRSAGLALVDVMPPVKHVLAKKSMGLSGTLSRLARHLDLDSVDRHV